MNFNEIIEKTLVEAWDAVRLDVIASYETKNMRASGDFADSLEVIYKKNTVSLMGNKYVEQLEYGRKPSATMPPIQAIYDWIVNKNIMDRTEKEYKIRGLAYVIARKIQREGYNRANTGGVNLISDILTDDRIKRVIDLVGSNLFGIFEAEITTFFKTNSE